MQYHGDRVYSVTILLFAVFNDIEYKLYKILKSDIIRYVDKQSMKIISIEI